MSLFTFRHLWVRLMENLLCDFLVIGSGPAGQKSAIQAAKLGKSVIVIEKDKEPGGASINSGTIPSKSLREAILVLTGVNERSCYSKAQEPKDIYVSDLFFRLQQVLAIQLPISPELPISGMCVEKCCLSLALSFISSAGRSKIFRPTSLSPPLSKF